MSGGRLGKTLKPKPVTHRSMKVKGYVQMWVKKETRDKLIALKSYGDTYDSIINLFLRGQIELKLDDYAAQNIDHVDGDDEERGA